MQYFEWYLPSDKSLWKQLINEAANIKAAGIDALWLPPAYKGSQGRNDVGYSVYDLYDLGEFYQKGTVETKYGSKDEYLEAIKTLETNGIEVLADIVLGHRVGADETDETMAYEDNPYNRLEQVGNLRKVRVWTKFNFYARKGKYSNFRWNWTHFDGVDYDEITHNNSLLRFEGKQWEEEVDDELGNYDYLLGADTDMDNTEVVNELKEWGKWYVNFTNITGVRLDAVKHIKFSFYKEWLTFLREQTNKELYSVAEYWSNDLGKLNHYLDVTEGTTKLFDVPLHFRMFEACHNHLFYMGNIFKGTLVEANSEMAVTFVDNHDSQIGQALESWICEWFKPQAYALILLRTTGDPCVFYSDFYGEKCHNFSPVNNLKTMLQLRKTHVYGNQHDYLDDEHIIGWTVEDYNNYHDKAIAVLLTNQVGGTKKMYVGEEYVDCEFYDVTGNVDITVPINSRGMGRFIVNEKSLSIWIKCN